MDKIFKSEPVYTWQPDIEVVLTGKEFETLYNGLKNFMASEGKISAILQVAHAFALLNQKMKHLIEEGKVTKGAEEKIQ